MRCHLIVDAPYTVIVLAHRLSLGFCTGLLNFRPNLWGRVFGFFFFFLIERTFEPVVIFFGCLSQPDIWATPPSTHSSSDAVRRFWGVGEVGPLRHMALMQVSHQPRALIWLTSQCQWEHWLEQTGCWWLKLLLRWESAQRLLSSNCLLVKLYTHIYVYRYSLTIKVHYSMWSANNMANSAGIFFFWNIRCGFWLVVIERRAVLGCWSVTFCLSSQGRWPPTQKQVILSVAAH